MSCRSRRTPVEAFPALPEGIQKGLFKLVMDNSTVVASMLDVNNDNNNNSSNTSNEAAALVVPLLVEKCAQIMKQQQLSASTFLARFFHANILSEHATTVLNKSGKGSAATLSDRIATEWMKNNWITNNTVVDSSSKDLLLLLQLPPEEQTTVAASSSSSPVTNKKKKEKTNLGIPNKDIAAKTSNDAASPASNKRKLSKKQESLENTVDDGGWMTKASSKRKRMHDNSAAANSANRNDKSDSANKNMLQQQQQQEPSPKREELPLDWTRVKRKQCTLPTIETTFLNVSQLTPRQQVTSGFGVICLHDSNPAWFQGYFFPNRTTQQQQQQLQVPSSSSQSQQQQKQKPWGLLAVQEALDECMECADGGYRRISLTVFPFSHGPRNKVQLKDIEVTGGDMVRFAGTNVRLEPQQLMTGSACVPIVEELFADLVQKCRNKLSKGEPDAVLDIMPDVTIVMGPMKLILPRTDVDDDAVDNNGGGDDDFWGS